MDQAQQPLQGHRALVVGAGTPVGAAIAVALAEAGADVAVAAASIDGAEVMAVRRTRRRIEALGRRTADYAFDVTLGQNVVVSTRQVAKALGGLDILVYAVDEWFTKPIDRVTDAEWSRVLTANLSGAFYACRAAVREMTAAGWGRILLVAAGAGPGDLSGLTAYGAARYGVSGLARTLAAEVAPHGIEVHTLVPAWLLDDAGAVASGPAAIATLAVRLIAQSDQATSGQSIGIDAGA